MKKIIAFFALFLVSTVAMAQNAMRIEINQQSSMVVNGGSTVRDWKAFVSTVSGHVVLRVKDDKITGIDSAQLFVKVSDMDARNGAMNSKMHTALKAKEHPVIEYVFEFAELNDAGTAARVAGDLTVAGTTHPLTSDVQLSQIDNGTIECKGSFSISLAAFEIKAPTAMMGLLKTHDTLDIDFTLVGKKITLQTQK